ncbi:uncharacterized protein si:dkey-9i23.16 [Girardinichthys multiradiatus]|uniref:uncharacterized protein si:dkey-9i23.16 n=1 Tax=Girardinichthys multiradiatus TaxID=208333 RepID=UPI001FABD8CD|nr:uncharacterized protein si:dkey-9i23.16 [Girardinichthys multiradiatus]
MASEREDSADEARWYRLFTWFDIEIAAVVTILLGLFQLLLSASLIQTDKFLPKFFFILPFVLGIVIVAGGSFTISSKKNPSKLLLRGCAWSNVLGLLGSLLAFCIYSYILKTQKNMEPCLSDYYDLPWDPSLSHLCPPEALAAYIWSLTLQMLLYDTAAVVMHFLLSVCAFKTLKKD